MVCTVSESYSLKHCCHRIEGEKKNPTRKSFLKEFQLKIDPNIRVNLLLEFCVV